MRYAVAYRVWDRFGLRFLSANEITLNAEGKVMHDQPERFEVDLFTMITTPAGERVFANDIVEAIVEGKTITDAVIWFEGAWRLSGRVEYAIDIPIIRVTGNLRKDPWPTGEGKVQHERRKLRPAGESEGAETQRLAVAGIEDRSILERIRSSVPERLGEVPPMAAAAG